MGRADFKPHFPCSFLKSHLALDLMGSHPASPAQGDVSQHSRGQPRRPRGVRRPATWPWIRLPPATQRRAGQARLWVAYVIPNPVERTQPRAGLGKKLRRVKEIRGRGAETKARKCL